MIMTPQQFRDLALSFPGTEENPHFDRAAFKIIKKRIFATMHEASMMVNMKLTVADQKTFSKLDKKNIYPLPNKWGEGGWTTFEIANAEREVILAALEAAYQDVVRPKGKV
jgi:predicted DNA-binding protein (MmcQ/YjbR family)